MKKQQWLLFAPKRILSEYKKYAKLANNEWAIIAAHKLWAELENKRRIVKPKEPSIFLED